MEFMGVTQPFEGVRDAQLQNNDNIIFLHNVLAAMTEVEDLNVTNQDFQHVVPRPRKKEPGKAKTDSSKSLYTTRSRVVFSKSSQ